MNLTAYQRIHSFSLLFYFHLFESLFIKRYLLLQALTESAKLCITSVLMSYVPRALLALVLYVLSYPTYLEPYVPHALRALMLHVPRTILALVPRALRALVPYVSRVLRALVHQVPHVPCVILLFTCLVPCVFSCCSCSFASHPSLASGV